MVEARIFKDNFDRNGLADLVDVLAKVTVENAREWAEQLIEKSLEGLLAGAIWPAAIVYSRFLFPRPALRSAWAQEGRPCLRSGVRRPSSVVWFMTGFSGNALLHLKPLGMCERQRSRRRPYTQDHPSDPAWSAVVNSYENPDPEEPGWPI